jgi:hypothetical protein
MKFRREIRLSRRRGAEKEGKKERGRETDDREKT